MGGRILGEHTLRKGLAKIGTLGLLALFSFGLASCGSNSSSTGMGSANVSMSDPPSSTAYSNVWVTVDGVEASTSTSDTGWVSLDSSLSSTSGSIKAVQVDLLNLPTNAASTNCLLALLGSTQSLPAGNYQQIRLMLVPNNANAAGVTLLSPSGEPTQNQCANAGLSAWNCAMPTGGSMETLQLSSQAQTGLKIPPGQVLGGPISVTSGQSVDINIDFNADRSIVNEAGQLQLDPVLVAYQANPINTSAIQISGQVMEGTSGSGGVTSTGTAIANANVALEMSEGTDGSYNVDLIGNYLEQTDSSGNFYFCPMPTGNFDVVVSAGPTTTTSGTGTTTTTYGATIVTDVPTGTQLTKPLLLLSQANGGGELTGKVTDTGVTTETADNLYTLQQATDSLEFAVPFLSNSTPSMPQLCTGGSCTGDYDVFVPASNPLVGSFVSGSITWTLPAASPFTYKVEATCNGGTVAQFSSSQSVMAGIPVSVPTLTLPAGCQ